MLMNTLEREVLVHLLSKPASGASPSCLLPHKVHLALGCPRLCAGLDTRQRRKHGSFESSTVQLQSCGHAVGTQWALPLDNTSSTGCHDNLTLPTSLQNFLLSSLLLGLRTLDLLRGDLSRKLIPSQPESLCVCLLARAYSHTCFLITRLLISFADREWNAGIMRPGG